MFNYFTVYWRNSILLPTIVFHLHILTYAEAQNTVVQYNIQTLRMRSCRGRAVKTSDSHTGGPHFETRPGSSALGLSEDTLVPCMYIGE